MRQPAPCHGVRPTCADTTAPFVSTPWTITLSGVDVSMKSSVPVMRHRFTWVLSWADSS